MTTTTTLLDKFKEIRSLPSDNACAVALGLHRATVSGWRKRGTQAEAHVIAQLAKAVGDQPGVWLAMVEAERAKSEADKRAWHQVIRQLGAAAVLAVVAALPLTSQAAVSAGKFTGNAYYVLRRWLARMTARRAQLCVTC